jgi:site-specific recombinase XerD
LEKLIEAYLEYRKTLNLSRETLKSDRTALQKFQSYLTEHDLTFGEVTKAIIKDYWESLVPLASRPNYLFILKQFYRYAATHDRLLLDPFYNLELNLKFPLRTYQIPTPQQLRQILEQIDLSTPLGRRDRALLELVYSSGLRANETLRLDLNDLDLKNRLVKVRGKGGKQRIVPFGKTAAFYLKLYMKDRDRTNPALFQSCTPDHRRIGPDIPGNRFHYHAEAFDLSFKFHSLRHACALHLLQNKAGIRLIQELLGHSELNSTQIYTKLLPLDLKKAHRRYHPREKEAAKHKQGIPASSFQIGGLPPWIIKKWPNSF